MTKTIKTKEILYSFMKTKNGKSIKDCGDKVTKSKNDTNNHNRDISRSVQYDTTDLERQIDDLVYQLYELTQDETKTIKSK